MALWKRQVEEILENISDEDWIPDRKPLTQNELKIFREEKARKKLQKARESELHNEFVDAFNNSDVDINISGKVNRALRRAFVVFVGSFIGLGLFAGVNAMNGKSNSEYRPTPTPYKPLPYNAPNNFNQDMPRVTYGSPGYIITPTPTSKKQ